MRNRVLVCGVLSAVVLFAVVAGLWLLGPRCGVTLADYDKLHGDMTEQEVTALLGPATGHSDQAGKRRCEWRGTGWTITVAFNSEGQMVVLDCQSNAILDRLRDLFRR